MAYIRSPLLKSVHSRLLEDERLQSQDHSYWYTLKEEALATDVRSTFIQSHEDQETQDFLGSCYDKSDWVLTQLSHLFAKMLLSWFMTNTSINGLLHRGSMFVYSTSQFQQLLNVTSDWTTDTLLDLGAGDGMVTMKMAPHFKTVYVTEASSTMVWRLQQKGYHIQGIDEWHNGERHYDVISCLNLLDRCDKPATLLRHIHQSLTPHTGRLVVALVFPFKPYVEFGNKDHKPTEFFHIEGESIEKQISSFVHNVFEPSGFVLERFTRLPYLCEGDLEHSFYLLNDIVFVLKPT